MSGPAARLVGRASVVVAALLVLLAVRVLAASHDEHARAEQLRASGDLDGAIVHYRRAARLYVPGSPHVAASLRALAAIARESESAGETARALAAWRAVHAAVLASRSLYVPHDAALTEADAHLAALAADDPPPVDAAVGRAAREQAYLRALERARAADPARLPVLLLLAGFAAWIGGALGLLRRGVDDEARLRVPEARRFGAIMAIGFAAFVAGLALA